MKYYVYLFCFTILSSCIKEDPGDIRPLIPGEYEGEISYLEFSETEEEFVLNPQTFPVTVVINKIDNSYQIEFSKNHPLDIEAFYFTLYPLFESYASSAYIRVAYGGEDPCPIYFSYAVDKKNGGNFLLESDRIRLNIHRYYCTEPENSFKIEFVGSK
jgi:hypothetical protein